MQEILHSITNVTESSWWGIELIGGTVGGYIIAFTVFLGLWALFMIAQRVVLHKLALLAEKTATDIDDTLVTIVKSLRPPFYSFLALYVSLQFLALSDSVGHILNILLLVWVIYQVITASQILIGYIAQKYIAHADDPSASAIVGIVTGIARAILWVFAVLIILTNVGVDVTSLVAGLGIGGIAIALALQNILGDLFSSFAIFFDKPFEVGDYVKVGDKSGVVKKIGIKTTRIRATGGEEIVISNKELTSAQLLNFKRMEERRISYAFGVTYDTSAETLKKIPVMVQRVIGETDNVRFDRSHFKSFDDSALSFETIFYVHSSNYADYMDALQEINLAIKSVFDKEGIDMAYPTQTLFIKKDTV